MTRLLEKVFEEASKVPEIEQDTLARRILEELESERRWETAFATSEDVVEAMADEALAGTLQGKTRRMDVKKL